MFFVSLVQRMNTITKYLKKKKKKFWPNEKCWGAHTVMIWVTNMGSYCNPIFNTH